MYKFPEYLPHVVAYAAGQNAKLLAGILGISALLLSCGFLFTDSSSHDYKLLVYLFSAKVWAAILLGYGSAKLCKSINGVNLKLDLLTTMFGVWLWTYIFISFVVFDNNAFTPIEILLLLPLIIEAWELVLDIYNFRACKKLQKESI